MKLEQLRYFLETAKLEHIGRAAKALAISPSTISHSIAALEEEFSKPLFVKKGRQIYLTNHGKLLAEHAEKILAESHAISQAMTSENIALHGHYRIAATHGLCDSILIPAWMNIQKQHPQVTAEIITLRSADVVNSVSNGETDLGLCFSPLHNPNINNEVIYLGQQYIIVRKNHPILKKPKTSQINFINDYPAILPKAFQGIENCQTPDLFEFFSIKPNTVLLHDSYQVAVNALINSDMWSLIPNIALWSFKNKLASIIPKNWDAPLHVSIVTPKRRHMTQLLQELNYAVQALLNKINHLI